MQLQEYVNDNDATYNCDLEEMKAKEDQETEENNKKKQNEEKIAPPKNISSVYPLFP